MVKILILTNSDVGLYNFRKELIEKLVSENEVFISLPFGEYTSKLSELNCRLIDTPISRRGTNFIADFKLLMRYKKIFKEIKPDIILTYTIKPNVYGGIISTITKTPYITNVTGMGSSIENESLIKKITLKLYKLALKKSSCVFFQNNANQHFFQEHKIIKNKVRLIPGSGVNLEEHQYEKYPIDDKIIRFLYIGRIMKDKGIEELLEAAKVIKNNYDNVQFELIGSMEEEYSRKIESLEKQNIIKYYGRQKDVHSFIKKSHATILPSYHEGLSNVLLESASSGRPVLASNVPGCLETFDEGVTGYGFEVRNVESLVAAISKFIDIPYIQKEEMGYKGRLKVEKEFNRELVVNAYLDEIDRVTKVEKEI